MKMSMNARNLVTQMRWVSLVAVAALATCLLGNSTATGQTIASDDFSDGDVTSGPLSWIAARGTDEAPFTAGVPNLAVQNDDGVGQLNGGNAMIINRSNPYGSGVSTTGAIAFLPGGGRQLANVGDFIKVELDVRFLGLPVTSGGFSRTASNRAFRVGFVNAGGDTATTGIGRNGDNAYYLNSGMGKEGGAPGNTDSTEFAIIQEHGDGRGGGAPMDGGDGYSARINMAAGTAVNDTLPHTSVMLSLTKELVGTDVGVRARASFNGVAVDDFFFAGSHTGNSDGLSSIDLDRVDYLGIMGAKIRTMDILVDNVRITSNAPIVPFVPEPSSLVLFTGGLISLCLRRRKF